MNQNDFLLGVAHSHVVYDNTRDIITPDNKAHEGLNSAGLTPVAPWLPVIRYSDTFKTYVVISSQTPVAMATDKRTGEQWLVPAGLGLADADLAYTDEDVRLGIKDTEGNLVTAGTKVKDTFGSNIVISSFVGIVNYDAFRHPGGKDSLNPVQNTYFNYNPQPGVSYNMDYAYVFPMVKDAAEYAKAPLKGISAFIGTEVLAGQFITYDKDSKFVVADSGFGYGSTPPERIIGQVSKVVVLKDPNTGEVKNTFNCLDQVTYGYPFANDPLQQMPGKANGGLTTQVSYANAYGLVHFAVQTR